MKDNELIYDWLDFMAINKSANKTNLLKEQVYKASQTNPGAAA